MRISKIIKPKLTKTKTIEYADEELSSSAFVDVEIPYLKPKLSVSIDVEVDEDLDMSAAYIDEDGNVYHPTSKRVLNGCENIMDTFFLPDHFARASKKYQEG